MKNLIQYCTVLCLQKWNFSQNYHTYQVISFLSPVPMDLISSFFMSLFLFPGIQYKGMPLPQKKNKLISCLYAVNVFVISIYNPCEQSFGGVYSNPPVCPSCLSVCFDKYLMHSPSFTDKLKTMNLYTVAVYNLRMGIKEDNLCLNYFKGDKLLNSLIVQNGVSQCDFTFSSSFDRLKIVLLQLFSLYSHNT